MDALRQQVMVNQFAYVTGCQADQAHQYLVSTNWHFDSALSQFFEESPIPSGPSPNNSCHFKVSTPTNTPVTPPSFPDTLASFSKLLSSTEKLKTTSTGVLSPSSQGSNLQSQFNAQFHRPQ